jgi:uncharacterized protein
MIDGIAVINAIVHPYDLSEANVASDVGAMVRHGFGMLHSHWNAPGEAVPIELFEQDQPIDVLAEALFLESDVDIAVCHSLRLDSLFRDGLCGRAKNVELQRRWPQRFISYVGIDPTLGLARSLDELDEQVSELPSAVGMKLYPDQINPYRTFRMDDPELMFPLYERALQLGLKVVAVHKALPNGPVPLAPYKVDDVEGAAMHFPSLNFEIVHAGMAFVDETAYALARFPNVYANLEVTAQLLSKAPRLFGELLATFMFWSGPTKVLWGDGANFTHPDLMLQRFWNFEFPDDIRERFGVPPLEREFKRMMLGQNYADMIGLDLDARMALIADDEWSQRRAAQGEKAAPYTAWKRSVGAQSW